MNNIPYIKGKNSYMKKHICEFYNQQDRLKEFN